MVLMILVHRVTLLSSFPSFLAVAISCPSSPLFHKIDDLVLSCQALPTTSFLLNFTLFVLIYPTQLDFSSSDTYNKLLTVMIYDIFLRMLFQKT